MGLSLGETVKKSREVLDKLGTKNYEDLLNESKRLLEQFVGFGESTLGSIEAQEKVNTYIKERMDMLIEQSKRTYIQGIDKTVKDTYGKSELGKSLVGN